MPNWCYTSYVVTGDEKEVCDLYEKMRSLEQREESLVENGFGKNWLGNLVTLLGADWHKVFCRGSWYDLEKDGEKTLRFWVESAWSDPDQVIDLLKEKYPSLEFIFRAEEPGMNYYVTNDATGDYFERYALDADGEQTYYWEGELNELLRDVENIVGKKVETLAEANDAIDKYNEENVDEWCQLIVFKVV